MFPKILHIYGPIWINSYGFMIAIGFILFLYLTISHPLRKKLVSKSDFLDALFVGLVCGVIGGRLLFVFENLNSFKSNWLECFYPWIGGFSILGTIIGILIVMPIYLRSRKIAVFPFLDLCSIYAPLLQSISRIGCFLAGCCYGQACTTLKWSIVYKNHNCLAPLNIALHPTQLYSSLASFSIFLIIRFIVSKKAKISGQIVFSYLLLESLARFTVDFWRGDRDFINLGIKSLKNIFTFYQLIAVILFLISVFVLVLISIKGKRNSDNL